MLYGKRIKKARINKGLTQRQLAEKVSVHPNAIGEYERGTVAPSFFIMVKISKALDVSLDWLAGGYNYD
jgi:transcriptional regulator with XRE-family HTH domain